MDVGHGDYPPSLRASNALVGPSEANPLRKTLTETHFQAVEQRFLELQEQVRPVWDLSRLVTGYEADENGDIDVGPVRLQSPPDDFDRYASLKDPDEVEDYRALMRPFHYDTGHNRSNESAKAIPRGDDILTPEVREQLKSYKNPYEELKKQGNSGESSHGKFGDSDDTYLWVEQMGGQFRNDDFSERFVQADNQAGYTVYWEPGDIEMWETAWPRLCKDVLDIEKVSHKWIVETKGKDYELKLLNPPKDEAFPSKQKLSDLVQDNRLYDRNYVFELIDPPEGLPRLWSLENDSGYGHIAKLGYFKERFLDPESFEIFHKDHPKTRLKLCKKLHSLDWCSVPDIDMGHMVLITLFRAKSLAGGGIKLQADGIWGKGPFSEKLLKLYYRIWPDSQGHRADGRIPKNPYETDPDWYYTQTNGEGEPARAYNQRGIFGSIDNKPGSAPGVRYHAWRSEKYVAKVFGDHVDRMDAQRRGQSLVLPNAEALGERSISK